MFVVVGEALVDLVGPRGGRTLEAHPGGSPANVALGLGRLGDTVTLKTRLGRDAFGEMILGHLEDLVDTVGAGDSFTSGLLHGLHRADLLGGTRREGLAAIDEATLVSVVDSAAIIAAITCSRPGADPPTRDEVEARRTR